MSWFNPNKKSNDGVKESDRLAIKIRELETRLDAIPDEYTDDRGQEKRNNLQAEINDFEKKRAEAIRKEAGS